MLCIYLVGGATSVKTGQIYLWQQLMRLHRIYIMLCCTLFLRFKYSKSLKYSPVHISRVCMENQNCVSYSVFFSIVCLPSELSMYAGFQKKFPSISSVVLVGPEELHGKN